MSESDSETLFEEPLTSYKPSLGKRGRFWRAKLLQGIISRLKIMSLKAMGKTDDEIVEEEPGYYYDEEYHGLASESWFRRNKTTSNLGSAVGTSKGYSAWEWCGDPRITKEVPCHIG
jgi:hypothetical protein